MADHFDRALRRRDGNAEADIRRCGQSQAEQHHGKIQFKFTVPFFIVLNLYDRYVTESVVAHVSRPFGDSIEIFL